MSVNFNHIGYERRLLVVELFHSRGLQPCKISTLAYSSEYKYLFSYHLYKVEIATPASTSDFPRGQPETTEAPPDGVSTLVIKLSDLAVDGMNNANRVENDVAAQYLTRQSMKHAGLPPLVPAIYAWEPSSLSHNLDKKDFGWLISELKIGVELDTEFASLVAQDKQQVLE